MPWLLYLRKVSCINFEKIIKASNIYIIKSLNLKEIETLKNQMYEELKAQMQMNQKLLQENNTSFKERVRTIECNRFNLVKFDLIVFL